MRLSIKTHWLQLLLALISSAIAGSSLAIAELPPWEALEFEKKAFWATAKSRLEVPQPNEDNDAWELLVESSVVDNSEKITLIFNPDSREVQQRVRLSRGKDRRLKSYKYQEDSVLRERKDPEGNHSLPLADWPVSSSRTIKFPASSSGSIVTDTYMLLLLASDLQQQGPDATQEVIVHTDLNFFRVRMKSGNGIPIDVHYKTSGGEVIKGRRETVAVSLQVEPEGELAEDRDFNFLGLESDIIVLFDQLTGVPLQIRGNAPRIGATEINLGEVTLRDPDL